jgi:hypothetical protein
MDQVDMRPRFVESESRWLLHAAECDNCHYRSIARGPWCPVCHGEQRDVTFGPGGTVWAATIVRVPVGGYPPPRALAYIDIDDGPRVICEVEAVTETALEVGTRVVLRGPSDQGNPMVRLDA